MPSRQIDQNSARIERERGPQKQFIASPPGDQNAITYRQFVNLQLVLNELTQRVAELEAKVP